MYRFFCVALIFMHGLICAMEKEPLWKMSFDEFREWKNKRTETLVAHAKKLGKFCAKDGKEWGKLCKDAVPYPYCGQRQFIECSNEYSLQQAAVSFAVVNECNNKFIAALIDAGFEFDHAVWNDRDGHVSPLQIAIKEWRLRWSGCGQAQKPLLTVQLLLERGASLSPKNGFNTLSLFLTRPPMDHGYAHDAYLQDCEQWRHGIKYLLALGTDPGERPAGHLETGRGNDAPYMELATRVAGQTPRFGDGRDGLFYLSLSRHNYHELVSWMRAHVPEQEVRLLLQRQLVCNRVLNSVHIGCSLLKKKLRDMVFGKIREHTIDNWTQNGQMRLCNADGGVFNWLSSRWDGWQQLSSLEKYVYPPEKLRPLVEADLKRQLALWAKKRRKIDLGIDVIATPQDAPMNAAAAPLLIEDGYLLNPNLVCQVGYCSVQ